MTIEQRHFDEAERMLTGSFAQHSDAFREGQRYALAWCLAGKPAATSERNRETACPYERGTTERDAWQSGWASGHATAVHARIVKATGVIHELPLPQGGHVLITEPEIGGYAWEITDEKGETLREAEGYPLAVTALSEALSEALPSLPDLSEAFMRSVATWEEKGALERGVVMELEAHDDGSRIQVWALDHDDPSRRINGGSYARWEEAYATIGRAMDHREATYQPPDDHYSPGVH